MSEITDLMNKGELFAQGHALLALIATHPDLAELKRAFLNISERHTATILAGTQADALIGAYRFSCERWIEWMDAATQFQSTQTIPAAPPL